MAEKKNTKAFGDNRFVGTSNTTSTGKMNNTGKKGAAAQGIFQPVRKRNLTDNYDNDSLNSKKYKGISNVNMGKQLWAQHLMLQIPK